MGGQRISYLVRHAQLAAIGVGVAAQHISAVGIRLASEAAPEMADRSLFRAAEPSAFVALHTRARIGRAYRAVFRAFLIRAARRAIVQRVARKTNVTVFRGPWITALDTPGRGWPRRSVDGNLLACEAERRRRPAVAVLATRRAAGRAQIAVRARLKETVGLPSGRASEPVRDRAHGNRQVDVQSRSHPDSGTQYTTTTTTTTTYVVRAHRLARAMCRAGDGPHRHLLATRLVNSRARHTLALSRVAPRSTWICTMRILQAPDAFLARSIAEKTVRAPVGNARAPPVHTGSPSTICGRLAIKALVDLSRTIPQSTCPRGVYVRADGVPDIRRARACLAPTLKAVRLGTIALRICRARAHILFGADHPIGAIRVDETLAARVFQELHARVASVL
jgi:hypothetical protein